MAVTSWKYLEIFIPEIPNSSGVLLSDWRPMGMYLVTAFFPKLRSPEPWVRSTLARCYYPALGWHEVALQLVQVKRLGNVSAPTWARRGS
ncbi:hypothetical protein UVI_02060730 [Ustilaginoidea virens]|uniref:Uncharacterized protein n=1 Tax=Ustilaginoidea virens TaxID=1159556 RepID=A0A1B5L8Z7_USTVR|nr:hypothetical protein UVI_02060730 [Ustilaginoidea virens]